MLNGHCLFAFKCPNKREARPREGPPIEVDADGFSRHCLRQSLDASLLAARYQIENTDVTNAAGAVVEIDRDITGRLLDIEIQ